MGLWGASQAIAFGLGGFFGASAVDVGRSLLGADGPAFERVFAFEASIFIVAAILAARLNSGTEAASTRELMA
jgi:BCD family chlorophyll transporter-like MFS transporter